MASDPGKYWNDLSKNWISKAFDTELKTGQTYKAFLAKVTDGLPEDPVQKATAIVQKVQASILNIDHMTAEQARARTKAQAHATFESGDLDRAIEDGWTDAVGVDYLAFKLLLDAGVHPRLVYTVDRGEGVFHANVPCVFQFSDYLIVVPGKDGKSTAWFDPGNRFSVPYAYTVTLIGYNATKMAELGLPTDTWALIFEPRYLEQIKGKVTVLNSQRELLAAAMIYLGHSPQSTEAAHWEAAKQVVLRAKPYWATFSNSTYIKDLAVGNIWVAHGYSNDMFRAREDAKDAGRPFTIGFTTPKEGAVLALDSFVLHKGGRRPDLAHKFIDFMLDGANAADVSNLIGAGNPTAAAMAAIHPEIGGNPAIFPPASEVARLQMLRDFDPGMRRLLSRLWTEIKVR